MPSWNKEGDGFDQSAATENPCIHPMKTRSSGLILTLLAAALIAAGLHTRAQETTQGTEQVAVTSDRFLVRGEVIARTEGAFTVLTQDSQLKVVRVSRDTSIVKGAETIALAEIAVGDRVAVTLRRIGDGGLLAVNVAVRTGFEPQG